MGYGIFRPSPLMGPQFGVLRYIANFKGDELLFSRSLSGVHAKLLADPKKVKL